MKIVLLFAFDFVYKQKLMCFRVKAEYLVESRQFQHRDDGGDVRASSLLLPGHQDQEIGIQSVSRGQAGYAHSVAHARA